MTTAAFRAALEAQGIVVDNQVLGEIEVPKEKVAGAILDWVVPVRDSSRPRPS